MIVARTKVGMKFGNPGESLLLPERSLVSLTHAVNLPQGGYWMKPLDHDVVGDALHRWSEKVGCHATKDEVEILSSVVGVNPVDFVEVGEFVTYCGYSDREPYEVVKIGKNRLTTRRAKTTLLNGVGSGERDALQFSPGGFSGHTSGHQRWKVESDPNGEEKRFSRRVSTSGKVEWIQIGWPKRSPGGRIIYGSHKHYDFNF